MDLLVFVRKQDVFRIVCSVLLVILAGLGYVYLVTPAHIKMRKGLLPAKVVQLETLIQTAAVLTLHHAYPVQLAQRAFLQVKPHVCPVHLASFKTKLAQLVVNHVPVELFLKMQVQPNVNHVQGVLKVGSQVSAVVRYAQSAHIRKILAA